MEPLDLAMLIFIVGVIIVSAIGFFKSYKNKED